MKNLFSLLLLSVTSVSFLFGQQNKPNDVQQKAIASLIGQYSEAREKSDTALLKNILTNDVDQLISSGEWRNGIGAAIQGMLKSSATNPGTRTLTIKNTRMINSTTAIVDCSYEIKNTDGSIRRMWSTFVVVAEKKKWKISAIRNMMPASS
ncbi:MAG TPA: DUF4440 domain-containing protein [Chitinophagaceae bacterium]